MPRRLLVTGGAGFIGTNFVRYWVNEHAEDRVVVLDALTYAGSTVGLEPLMEEGKLTFVHGNICDTSLVIELMRQHEIDTVVHFAAESHVDRSISGPDLFIESNIVGTHSLLKAARTVWMHSGTTPNARFHHISTDEVFGSLRASDPPFSETAQYAPNSPYAASKAASDHLVRAYHHTYGLPVSTSNCSNNYGPYQHPEKLIPLMVINVLRGKPLPVYGDGSNIRDWLFVEDHCRGIDAVIAHGKRGRTYNIGGMNEWSNIDLVRLLCTEIDRCFASDPLLRERFPDAPPASSGRSIELLRFVTDRPGHDWRYAIDATRACAELGFRPRESMASGLRRTIQWYLDNERWWRSAIERVDSVALVAS